MKKKIVIDARMYGLEHTGIGRYIINLVKNLKSSKFKFILLVKKEKLQEIRKDLGNRFEYIPTKTNHYSLAEQIEIPFLLNKIKPDLVHFPHFNASFFYRGRSVVTIHDLIKHYFRGKEMTTKSPLLYWFKYLSYRVLVHFSITKASLLIVPSNFWKQKLISDFGIADQKVLVTHEAVDPAFLGAIKKRGGPAEFSFQTQKPFFIYTGSVYPHKNIERLLKAIDKTPDVKLAIVCSRDIFTKRIENLSRQLKLKERVKFLGFIPDRKLIFLYQKAIALVQPSLMEGFGLTGLEAMACGCPVAASNASCLPEIYENAACYFNPLDVNDITQKLNLLITDKKLRARLVVNGKKQVKKFSWEKTAEKTMAGYQKLL